MSERLGYRIYQKMTETKPSALVSPPLDFKYRTVTFTFSYCFHYGKLIYQFTLKKSPSSKQPLLPIVVSGNNSTIASGRMSIPYSQEAKISRSIWHDYLVFEAETQAQIHSVYFLIAQFIS